MRRVLAPLLVCLIGLAGGVPSSTASAGPSLAEPTYAVERLGVGHYPGGVPSDSDFIPDVELTERGVFHIHRGRGWVWSYRFGTDDPWVKAPVTLPAGAITGAGTGDFVAAASLFESGAEVASTIRTVELGGTNFATSSRVHVPRIPDTSRSVRLAASGDRLYVAIAQGAAGAARSAVLLRSDDRGATWDAHPTDLIAAAGLPDSGPRPVIQLRAEGDLVAAVVGRHVLVSRDAATTFSPPTSLTPIGGDQGPVTVATDGDTVRVAWLQQTGPAAPELRSALVADGSVTDATTVPTAPSPLAQGVDTEIVLAALGSTYAIQVADGRLVSLDPDGVWRWPLRTEPSLGSHCAPGCWSLPDTVYGDRLVHRGYGRYMYRFVDRTPPHMTVLDGRAPVLPMHRTVTTRVDDEGGITGLTCRHTPGRASTSSPYCYAMGNRREGVHTLTTTVSDEVGNEAVLTHRWIVDGTAPRVRVTRGGPALVSDRAMGWSWRTADTHGVGRTAARIVRTPMRRAGVVRRAVPATSTSYAVRRPRPGETVCLEVKAWDVAGNRGKSVSCTSAMADDARLFGALRTVSGRSYRGGTASLLPPGRRVRTDPADRRGAVNWAFRLRTCPSCGSLLIATSHGDRRVDLRSDREGFTTVYARRLDASPRWTRLRGLVATGQVVVDGYWAIDL
ncbi:hypothetical protein [Nocardioides ochotonae]|uniref:hypothetical protein n=1 Tax=Nocardioides ochotonae TaxID=2685869 RepID=UPI00140DED07|nr:hypothetical protein [Nocardioides ochotonae]